MVCLISALSFAANEIKALTVPVFETVLSKDSVANDSITSKIEKDSIITSDISNKIEKLEAPVDTASLSLKSDSALNASNIPSKRWIPDSKKSLWMAMVLPGAGQIYNRKYWTIPSKKQNNNAAG